MLKDLVTGVPTVSRPSADLARRGHVTGAALRAAKMLGSGRPQPGRVAGPRGLCCGLVFSPVVQRWDWDVAPADAPVVLLVLRADSAAPGVTSPPGNAGAVRGLPCLRDLASLPGAVHGQFAGFCHFSPSSTGHSIFNESKAQPLKGHL